MTHEVLVIHEVEVETVMVGPPDLVEVETVTVGPPDLVEVEVGFQGPPGIPGAAFVHSQPSAGAEWVINHNLGVRPAVAVIDNGGNELDATVMHMSGNQLRIYFVTPIAGFARLT